MKRILLTCFEPYDRWTENASWLTLVELTKEMPAAVQLTTRRYPVDFDRAKQLLQKDLQADFDLALHLGQAPGAAEIRLEAFGVNLGGAIHQMPEDYMPLVIDGPEAYRSDLPLAAWARGLREQGVPARVSYHAGTYLCNATLYLSLHYAREMRLRTRAAFVHLPLAPQQAVIDEEAWPTMTSSQCADALRWIITTAAPVAFA